MIYQIFKNDQFIILNVKNFNKKINSHMNNYKKTICFVGLWYSSITLSSASERQPFAGRSQTYNSIDRNRTTRIDPSLEQECCCKGFCGGLRKRISKISSPQVKNSLMWQNPMSWPAYYILYKK